MGCFCCIFRFIIKTTTNIAAQHSSDLFRFEQPLEVKGCLKPENSQLQQNNDRSVWHNLSSAARSAALFILQSDRDLNCLVSCTTVCEKCIHRPTWKWQMFFLLLSFPYRHTHSCGIGSAASLCVPHLYANAFLGAVFCVRIVTSREPQSDRWALWHLVSRRE